MKKIDHPVLIILLMYLAVFLNTIGCIVWIVNLFTFNWKSGGTVINDFTLFLNYCTPCVVIYCIAYLLAIFVNIEGLEKDKLLTEYNVSSDDINSSINKQTIVSLITGFILCMLLIKFFRVDILNLSNQPIKVLISIIIILIYNEIRIFINTKIQSNIFEKAKKEGSLN